MDRLQLKRTSADLYRRSRLFITKTPQRKWTAVGVAVGLGLALIAVPPLGIAAFGGAVAGWWLVVLVVTIFGALIGNRAGVEVERRREKGL